MRSSNGSDPKVTVVRAPHGHSILRRVIILSITGVGLYVVWPKLVLVFSSSSQLSKINPLWGIPIVITEFASFFCIWALLRLALDVQEWFPIATAQLAGNAFSRIVPGGAAAGGAMQFEMLNRAGVRPTHAATSVTAVSIISTATLFGLPILSLPAIVLYGLPPDRSLVQVGLIAEVGNAAHGEHFLEGHLVAACLVGRE